MLNSTFTRTRTLETNGRNKTEDSRVFLPWQRHEITDLVLLSAVSPLLHLLLFSQREMVLSVKNKPTKQKPPQVFLKSLALMKDKWAVTWTVTTWITLFLLYDNHMTAKKYFAFYPDCCFCKKTLLDLHKLLCKEHQYAQASSTNLNVCKARLDININYPSRKCLHIITQMLTLKKKKKKSTLKHRSFEA